ncbi:BREX protein BrxB domain-containing protein [Desulfosediminicola sp.]|uniref:BREX protein BrxB domain-containing protein n=1 Tax=Desulfosediminicola sp. TaxID=2886825 RepID=UPI003AF23C71
MSLENRIDILKQDLLNPAGPCISTNRNYPFALFQYPPHEEFKMRARLVELLDTLRSKGWTILNVDLFSTLIDYLNTQEDGELIEALIEEEKLQYSVNKKNHSMPLSVLQNSLDIFLKDPQEYPKVVFDKIIKKTEHGDPAKTVIFLSRIGGLYPFYRTSSLLRYLDKGIRVPTIVLYPGERTEQYYLSFMGEMDADRDYRPRIY